VTLDVSVALVFLALTYLGYRAGLLSQAIRIGAIFAVIFAGPFVAALLRHVFFGETVIAAPLVEGFCLLLAGILIYASIAISGWLAVKTMRAASTTLSVTDRLGGSLVGAIKGLIIVYLLVFVSLFFESGLQTHDPDDRLRMRESHAAQFVKDYNVLAPWHFPDLVRTVAMIRVNHIGQETKQFKLLRESDAADLLRRSSLKPLLDDSKLAEAAMKDDLFTILADERVRELLKDEDLMHEVRKVDWTEIETRLMESQ